MACEEGADWWEAAGVLASLNLLTWVFFPGCVQVAHIQHCRVQADAVKLVVV